MPKIKPISDLRKKSNEISKHANNSDEPILISKNNEGDFVFMSMAPCSKIQVKSDLLDKLTVAQKQKSEGDKGRTLKQVMVKVRDIINTVS